MIKIEQVSKHYADIKALQQIDLQIEKGELFGILGPNGAGKTTLINILSTFLPPTNGKISMQGLRLNQDKKSKFPIIYLNCYKIKYYGSLMNKF